MGESGIHRRLEALEEQRAIEALWKDTARRRNEKRRKENGAAWYDFHMAMREVHSRLAGGHEEKALTLLGAGTPGEGGR